MQQIIVPTDFSELSAKGLDLAVMIAQKAHARIVAVHVFKHAGFTQPKETELNNIESRLNYLLQQYRNHYPHIQFETVVRQGKVSESIVRAAKETNDSVIVTSTHGASGLEELFIGSNTYKMVAESPRPVFTMRGKTLPNTINHIVMPIDNTIESREKVPYTTYLAKILKAKIHVVTVNSEGLNDIQQKLRNYAGQVCEYIDNKGGLFAFDELFGHNHTDITIAYAKKVDAGLISVMTEQERSISNVLLGSYAHQMINKAHIPVLLYPTRLIGTVTNSFVTQGLNINKFG